MKKLFYFQFAFLIIAQISCSNPNQEFIEKLKEEAANNELGVDLKYKVIDFEMIDTLYNQEQADSLQLVLDNNIADIKKIDLSKEVFLKFKNQELELRDDKNYYKNVVYNESLNSEWLTELRIILKKTDSLLSNFDNYSDIDKLELYSWYNRRFWQFNQNIKYENTFNDLYENAIKLKELENQIKSLKENPFKIIYYAAKVKFEQVNPLLGGAKQNLTKVRYFDENKNLINL